MQQWISAKQIASTLKDQALRGKSRFITSIARTASRRVAELKAKLSQLGFIGTAPTPKGKPSSECEWE